MHSRRYRIVFLLPLLMLLGVAPCTMAQTTPVAEMPEQPMLPMLGIPPSVGDGAAAASAASVKVYAAGALASTGYAVIRRVSATHWLTAITVRTYGTEEAARQALLDTAEREGGDGVMNLQCLRSAGPGSGALLRGYYCYGNIIKLK